MFISGRFVWYHFVWYSFVWGFLVWCFLSGAICPRPPYVIGGHPKLMFFPVVPFCMMSVNWYWSHTHTVQVNVFLFCVFSLAVFCFGIMRSRVLCTVNMLSIMIYLCNLAVKCTQLATWMGIKQPAPSSGSTQEMEKWVETMEGSLCYDMEGTLWRSNACEEGIEVLPVKHNYNLHEPQTL